MLHACLFAAAALVYLPALRYGFVGYDDTLLIHDNHEFLSHVSNAPRAFLQDAWHVPGFQGSRAYYRPILTLSFMADAQIGGLRPVVYHADSILLHALASCLLLAFLLRLGLPVLPAFLASLLFAVHPALASVAAWVPGRNDSLLAIFTLLAMIFLDRFLVRGTRRDWGIHITGFALALFDKEGAVLLPVIFVAYIALVARRKVTDRSVRILAAGWAPVLILWFLLRRSVVASQEAVSGLLQQMAGNLVVLVHYVGKTLIPVKLSVAPTIPDTPLWPGLVALALILAALVVSKNRRPGRILFGVLWYLAFAVPPLVVPILVGGEQRLYVPMIGLLFILLETDPVRNLGHRAWAVAAASVLILLFAGLTERRLGSFAGRQAYWESAVTASPHSAYSHASLGAFYMARNRDMDAYGQDLAALALNPVEPKVNGNLGAIAARAGRLAEAETYLEKEIEVNPGYTDAYFNLGLVYAQEGDFARATTLWEQVLKIHPDEPNALRQLAGYYAAHGRPDLAAEYQRRLDQEQ